MFKGEGLGTRNEAGKVVLKSLDRSNRRTLSGGEILGFSVGGVGAAVIIGMAVNRTILQRPYPDYIFVPALVIISSPAALPTSRAMFQHQSTRLRNALLKAGFCACCGYPLPDHRAEPREETKRSAPSEDGLVVCPECGLGGGGG